ncbi:MAG: YkgJ family cysteine cluster protein [Brevefilum sp.]|nr:YkgJ family cysteine cluster protein [Brevefilum sp.]MDW7755722.1 YkgJ family cysteine cluster protein [Brevefilum sp.]
MNIITDLNYIRKMGTKRENENWQFRLFLKRLDMDSRDVDAIVHRINEEVTSKIDCTECANCCKEIYMSMDQAEIVDFADGLNISAEQLLTQYLVKNKEEPSKMKVAELPCPFLKNNRCTNYNHRPKECRSYPHLHKKDFIFRLFGVMSNYGRCPIVFNVYEQLKKELWN